MEREQDIRERESRESDETKYEERAREESEERAEEAARIPEPPPPEEENDRDIIGKLKLIGDNGQGLLMLDAELGARVFTPPPAAVA